MIKASYILCIILTILSVVLYYVNSIIDNSKKEENSNQNIMNFIKIGLLTSFSVGITIYILHSPTKNLIGGSMSENINLEQNK